MTIPSIEQVIGAIPDWAGAVVTAERIAAGLTNTNWRVEVNGTPYFARIPGADTELLAVDRGNEIHNTIAAAQAGVAPRVVQTVPDWDVFALEWLDARTMSNETLRAAGMPSRIAAALRQLHAGPRFRDDFDMFRVAERYLVLVDERSIPIPTGYREHLGLIPRIEAALAVHPPANVPCHNDLLAANYLDDGTRLWLFDWEYSGNNDPAFELGNTAQELGYDDVQVEELCAAYYGEASPAHLARMRLQMIMSDVGWTLWAAIQARISTIDYDFAEGGLQIDVLRGRCPVHARPACRDPVLVAHRAGALGRDVRHVRVAVHRVPHPAVDDTHVRPRLPGRDQRLRLRLACHRGGDGRLQLGRWRVHQPRSDPDLRSLTAGRLATADRSPGRTEPLVRGTRNTPLAAGSRPPERRSWSRHEPLPRLSDL